MNIKLVFITIFAVAFVLIAGFCVAFAATDVTLEWDSNTEADMSYYQIYRSDDGGTTWIMIGQSTHTGDGTETFLDEAVPDGSYKWYVTAVDLSGNESLPSNIVGETLDSVAPAPPTGLWVKIKQIIAWLINWLFGWV